jgi:pimeloyl-ACP methyl ester carboxylesterase
MNAATRGRTVAGRTLSEQRRSDSMATETTHTPAAAPSAVRERALAGIPATERRMHVEGISTAVLEGGDGSPIVLLHGPGANASHWARVIPGLMMTHQVIAPDLPGQGASVVDGELTRSRVIDWLDALIDETCERPPVLAGNALGGGIAARFAIERPNGCARLVLVDALGLRPFEPSPRFGRALNEFVTDPKAETHDGLWAYCAHDLPGLRDRMGPAWDAMAAYNLDRARTPSVQKALGVLMGEFALPAIASEDLDRIKVPTHLVWGRHDEATPIEAAQEIAARHGWPLEVIEECADDPPVEQPEEFVRVLREAIGVENAL